MRFSQTLKIHKKITVSTKKIFLFGVLLRKMYRFFGTKNVLGVIGTLSIASLLLFPSPSPDRLFLFLLFSTSFWAKTKEYKNFYKDDKTQDSRGLMTHHGKLSPVLTEWMITLVRLNFECWELKCSYENYPMRTSVLLGFVECRCSSVDWRIKFCCGSNFAGLLPVELWWSSVLNHNSNIKHFYYANSKPRLVQLKSWGHNQPILIFRTFFFP